MPQEQPKKWQKDKKKSKAERRQHRIKRQSFDEKGPSEIIEAIEFFVLNTNVEKNRNKKLFQKDPLSCQ